MGKLRAHLTFANLVSVISLLFALGLGGAWAASELSKNEVKSKHIGKGQVKTKDLGKNAVTSRKVDNGSLLGEDFAPNQLPQGEQGPPGERGPKGDPGTALGYAHVNADGTIDTANSRNVPAGDTSTSDGVYCFSNLPFTPRNVQVTIDSGATTVATELGTAWASVTDTPGCADPGVQAGVNITKNGAFTAEPFFILFN
jgi:hypothetical protein